MQAPITITRLSDRPVLGVPMGQVSILRLDQTGGAAPGNKAYKLRENLRLASEEGVRRIVSFGGGWSNHLHALAAVGAELGLETVGLVRGEEGEGDTPTLEDARRWGMEIRRLPRGLYRRRNDPDFIVEIQRQYRPCVVVPEGGANSAGIRGCLALASQVRASGVEPACVLVPVGTGTTLAGLAAGLAPPTQLLGISALRGATDLEQRVSHGLRDCGLAASVPWHILHDFHSGGFARVDVPLRNFMLAFEQVHAVPLEPVYTGKMMHAIHSLLEAGMWTAGESVLAIHTGGLQGRRGYGWLTDPGRDAPGTRS